MNNVVDQAFLVGVDIFHKLAEAVFGIEDFPDGMPFLVERTLVGKRQRDARVEECEVAEAVCKRLVVVDVYGENRIVGMEGNRRAGGITLAYYRKIARWLALGIFLHVDFPSTPDLGAQIVGQGVDTAHTDAMQTTRHLIGTFVELTAGMEHCENHLKGTLMFLLVHVHGDAATVVHNGDGVILVDCYFNMSAESGESLVD